MLAFRHFQAAVYEVEIPNRVGFNAAGQAIDSPDSAVIEKEALARAENTIEFVRSYAVFAVLTSPLQFIAGVNFVAHVLDAALFLSALWLIHLGFRFLQGRPALERIGARAELYIDRKYIARMVERLTQPCFLTPRRF